METDEFDDIEVEDKLHVIISVKDFRAIVQHAGITGNDISARYSLPASPIQLSYAGDSISCEFLIMTVGERGANPSQKTKKGGKNAGPKSTAPRLEATSRRASVAPSEPLQPEPVQQQPPAPNTNVVPPVSTARASASRSGAFDLRPTQQQPPPPPTMRSESLFVDDDGGWEPVRDEEEDEEEDTTRLGWDHSAEPVSVATSTPFPELRLINQQTSHSFNLSRAQEERQRKQQEQQPAEPTQARDEEEAEASYLEPTQKLSDVMNLALFPD